MQKFSLLVKWWAIFLLSGHDNHCRHYYTSSCTSSAVSYEYDLVDTIRASQSIHRESKAWGITVKCEPYLIWAQSFVRHRCVLIHRQLCLQLYIPVMVSKIHETAEPSLLAATVRCTQTQPEYTARLFATRLNWYWSAGWISASTTRCSLSCAHSNKLVHDPNTLTSVFICDIQCVYFLNYNENIALLR